MNNLHSPLTGDHKLRQKSGRTPLQPKNSPVLTEIQILKPKQSIVPESNKENHPVYVTITPSNFIIEPLDASLEEELSAIRKKLERLKAEKEKTEKMLSERNRMLDLKMKEMEERGEIQKRFEIEVDRLFRLKELQSASSSSMRISPLRSLREKEHEKKISEANRQEMKGEKGIEGSVSAQSSCSSSSSKSISSQLVTVN
ncbi:hypothetical protein M5689_009579 [Euphorbia peplus]|nr:hypothetical protein M5689_009579 [Euphorbia peplus]